MIKTRIAPTPSGLLHRGNALNFLLTATIAREGGGELRLRIDDLDAPRMRPEYLQDVFDTLHWLGIRWQQGPKDAADHQAHFRQAYRLQRYAALLDQLKAKGQVFACSCSRKDLQATATDGQYPGTCRFKGLPLDAPGTALRLLTPPGSVMAFEDALMGRVSIDLYKEARDFIVRRRDGLPAYHLASLADDVDYGINTIVRGADLLLSTAAQLFLAQALELPAFPAVRFHHHPLLLDAEGAKLSKSAGSTSMRFLRSQGLDVRHFLQEFEQWRHAITGGK